MSLVVPHPPIAWRPHTTATGDPRVAPIVWMPCRTCWQAGRMLDWREAPNGEGKVYRPVTCWTCLGTGSVIR